MTVLMPVTEALQRVLADARPLAAESVPLNEALGRVLFDDLTALRTQPPAAVSALASPPRSGCRSPSPTARSSA